MLKETDFQKIERYIKGLSDDYEKAFVESLFLNGEENYTLRQSLEKDWDLMLCDTSPSGVNLGPLLDRIHHIIRKNEIVKQHEPLYRFKQIYMRAAAILLLPILIAGGLSIYMVDKVNSTSNQIVSSTIYAPLGSRVTFNLPDGTTGMLNSGSYLTYSLPFNNNRDVKLDGEAWFEVIRDEEYPFKINAGNSTIKVLGTCFNVSAYPTENYVEVVLDQGKVEFMINGSDEEILLTPSERLIFQNGNISKSITDPSKYSAWAEGKLVFRSDPMAEMARRIERWYNVKIELVDKELENYSFRATFEDDKLEDVLQFLCMTSPIRYQITPRILLDDGTYEKRKVKIYLEK